MVPFKWVTMDPSFCIPENNMHTPEEARIYSVEVDPHPDGNEVSITLCVTPFQDPSDFNATVKVVVLRDSTTFRIGESPSDAQEVTVHHSGQTPADPLNIQTSLISPEVGTVDRSKTTIRELDSDSRVKEQGSDAAS
jgi:hypothetical protein